MATTPTIYIPTAEQAVACRDCELAAYGTAASVKQWQRLLSNNAVVALAHGKAPSGVAVARFVDNQWELVVVAVRPTARRRGIGRTLIELLGEKSQLNLRLPETNTDALQFAKSCGFRPLKIEHGGYEKCDAIHLVRNPE